MFRHSTSEIEPTDAKLGSTRFVYAKLSLPALRADEKAVPLNGDELTVLRLIDGARTKTGQRVLPIAVEVEWAMELGITTPIVLEKRVAAAIESLEKSKLVVGMPYTIDDASGDTPIHAKIYEITPLGIQHVAFYQQKGTP